MIIASPGKRWRRTVTIVRSLLLDSFGPIKIIWYNMIHQSMNTCQHLLVTASTRQLSDSWRLLPSVTYEVATVEPLTSSSCRRGRRRPCTVTRSAGRLLDGNTSAHRVDWREKTGRFNTFTWNGKGRCRRCSLDLVLGRSPGPQEKYTANGSKVASTTYSRHWLGHTYDSWK